MQREWQEDLQQSQNSLTLNCGEVLPPAPERLVGEQVGPLTLVVNRLQNHVFLHIFHGRKSMVHHLRGMWQSQVNLRSHVMLLHEKGVAHLQVVMMQ